MRLHLSPPTPAPAIPRPTIPLRGSAARARSRLWPPLVLAAVVFACGPSERTGGGTLEALSAAGLARPFAARLSIATEYRPCGAPRPGAPPSAGCGPPPMPSGAVLAAAERASAAAGGADPEALHAAGLMDLVWGREGERSLDRALSQLAAAARLSERPAPVLADLSAARLVRAERTGSPRDLQRFPQPAPRLDAGQSEVHIR